MTWVEHLECHKTTVHTLYRSVVNSGLAFGARHWIATLQLQCERIVFFMATNVPTKDSTGRLIDRILVGNLLLQKLLFEYKEKEVSKDQETTYPKVICLRRGMLLYDDA